MANGRAAAPALGWGAQAPRGASGVCLVPVRSLSSAALATAKPAQGGQARACAVQPPRSPTGGLPEVWPLAPTAYSHPGSRRSSGYLWQGCLHRLFGDFLVFRFFFSFLFVVAAPNLPRPRGPDRVGCRLAAALPVPGSPARAGPRRAAGCSGGRVGGRCRWALLGPSAWTPVSGVSGGDARVQALLPGRARETFLRLALCFAREREPGAALRLPD